MVVGVIWFYRLWLYDITHSLTPITRLRYHTATRNKNRITPITIKLPIYIYIQVNLDLTDHCTMDDMLGPCPMHIKYVSYVYDGFCIHCRGGSRI